MGRRELSGDDRPCGKVMAECTRTGVRQDTAESDTISESRDGWAFQEGQTEYDLT